MDTHGEVLQGSGFSISFIDREVGIGQSHMIYSHSSPLMIGRSERGLSMTYNRNDQVETFFAADIHEGLIAVRNESLDELKLEEHMDGRWKSYHLEMGQIHPSVFPPLDQTRLQLPAPYPTVIIKQNT